MTEKKVITVDEVFTPATPANLTYIKRNEPERQFRRALGTSGKQIVIYGHTGSGKTTLLYNLLELQSVGHVTTRCTKGISIKDVLSDAFHQLGNFYIEQKEDSKEEKTNVGLKLGIDFFSFILGAETKDTRKEIEKRVVEFQANPNQLAKLFGDSGLIWVIEDFHKLDLEPKQQLSQIMKVFMDVAIDYPKLKIIAVGAVDSARQVVQYDSEMENRISEIHVPLMSIAELNRIIDKGEQLLNLNFYPLVKEKIVAYSSGLASVTHQLCRLTCENKNIEKKTLTVQKISEDDLEFAINEYVNEKSDSLKSTYEVAIRQSIKRKKDSPVNILTAALKVDEDTFTVGDIANEMSKKFSGYKSSNLRRYVLELTMPEKGEILRYNGNADTFQFNNPFLKGYCYIHLIKYPNEKNSKLHKEYRNEELLRKYLLEEYNKFTKDLEEGSIEDPFNVLF